MLVRQLPLLNLIRIFIIESFGWHRARGKQCDEVKFTSMEGPKVFLRDSFEGGFCCVMQ